MRGIPTTVRQSGITLVEVLVSLVIFSLGLLGAAGLQLSSLRSSQFSANAAVAASLAREYEEFMQTVGYAARSTGYSSAGYSQSGYYNGDVTSSSMVYVDSDTLRSPSLAADCTGKPCGSVGFARPFQQDWSSRVRAQLPGGRAVVCAMPAPFDPTTGNLSWPDCTTPGGYLVIFIGWTAKNDQGETIFGTDRPRLAINVYGNYFDSRFK